ncbi:MAG TPA: hypothetical protein VNR90_11100, partial [Vicinamibacterales bacterium]|nr:hypothetical protein [Vicinamibacterales bacterium]
MRPIALRELAFSSQAGAAARAPAAEVDAAGDPRPVRSPVQARDIAMCLTAIALLLRPMGPWFVRPAILAVAVLMILSPALLRSALAWGAIAVMVAVRIADDWPLADNHVYLLGYWAFAIALSLRARASADTLACSSRWLIGLAFVFAVLWKTMLSPDFLDGRFFRVTLLTDPRFGDAAQLIGGLSSGQLAANRKALELLPPGAELLDPPSIAEPARLRLLASAATWGIVAIEAAVALAMLLPAPAVGSSVRHGALLLFCGTTY